MNYENLKRLKVKLLELNVSQFDMHDFENACGTVCCVAGWTKRWFGTECRSSVGYMSVLIEFLDLPITDWHTGRWLCHSAWAKNFNTIEDAVKRIDYLLEHGDVPELFTKRPKDYYIGYETF